jgi:hypothetical protein
MAWWAKYVDGQCEHRRAYNQAPILGSIIIKNDHRAYHYRGAGGRKGQGPG